MFYNPTSMAQFPYCSAEVRDDIQRYINGTCVDPLLIIGKAGTGKSTLLRLLPRALPNFSEADLSELNAARGVGAQQMRSLFDFIQMAPFGVRRIVTIDEAHQLTAKQQENLRAVVDEANLRGAQIMLAQNGADIDQPLLTRFRTIWLKACDPNDWVAHLRREWQHRGGAPKTDDFFRALMAAANCEPRRAFRRLEEAL